MDKRHTKRLRHSGLFLLGFALLTCGKTVHGAEAPTADPTQEHFLEAMRDRAEGRYDEAIEILNEILTDKPQLHRARLELAVTLSRIDNYARAKELALEVLNDPQTPANVRISVLAFIAQLDHDAKAQRLPAHTWKPEVGLGWMYDTNVNAGPSAGSFVLEGVQWSLAPNSHPSSDTATLMSAGLTHQYQADTQYVSGHSDVVFVWQDYINLNRRDYSREHAFDQDVVSVGTGPAWVALHNWRAGLGAQVDYLRLGSDDLALFTSLLPNLSKQFGDDTWEIAFDGTLSRREFRQAEDQGRDSAYFSGQVAVGYTFPKARLSLQAGGGPYRENADFDYFSYDGKGSFAGVAWRPWETGSLFAKASERTYDYDGREPAPFLVARHDRTRQYTVGLNYTIATKRPYLKGLNLSLSFVDTDNASNVGIYEYRRQQTTFLLGKAF